MRPALWLVSLLLSGCLQLAKPTPSQHYYRLDYEPPVPQGQAQPVVLRIAPVRVAALYDRDMMVYTEDHYGVGTYHYHRWSTPPGEMINDLLGRDFAAAGLFEAVQQGPAQLLANYQLEVSVERLEEQNSAGNCQAQLALRAQLEDLLPGSRDAVLLRQSYAQNEAMQCNDPLALAAALSKTMRALSQQMQSDVTRAIARHRSAH